MTTAAGSLDVALTGERAQRAPSFQCLVTRECPAEWEASLRRCQGTFFHSPPGVEVGGPPGEAIFVRLMSGTELVGMGAGVRRSCRLSRTPRHIFFPTWPAILPGVPRMAALTAMMKQLERLGAAELVLESFDSGWSDGAIPPGVRDTRTRDEFVIPIDTSEKTLFDSLASGHRRQIRKGDRSGWRLNESEGDAARSLLLSVQELASQRAAARGNGFAVRVPQLTALDSAGRRPWGATLFAAWHDDTPLAAALVGWANGRAFYVMGGSTAAGYEVGASIWLHWHIARRLADSGFVTYNLGGAAASAATPGDPSHGLHRFKIGFGPRIVACRSMSWLLSSTHARVHQLGRWLGANSSTPSET